jgi:hypothetical protein
MNFKYYSHLWAVIHLAGLNYNENSCSKEEYTNFYSSLSSTLGCEKCVVHYKNFMTENPPDFDDLFGWTVKLHNSVNEMRGEPTFTREESIKYWLDH